MTALAWSAVGVWLVVLAGVAAAAWWLHRRNLRDRASSPRDHGLGLVVGDPAETMRRWVREQLLSMPKREIRRRFAVIWQANFPEAKRADEHFDRIANEVVPDTARKPKPHNNGGNK